MKRGAKGELELADKVYSSVPARVFGRKQLIEIGHYSGRSNVIYWLRERGIEPTEALVDRVFAYAKGQDSTLEELSTITRPRTSSSIAAPRIR